MYLVETGAIPTGVNLGLVLSAYSGTSMEVWTPPEGFDGCPNKTNAAADTTDDDAVVPFHAASAPGVEQLHASARQWVLPSAPSCLWNTMISPIAGFGLRAVIWNQGESNMGDTFDRFSCVFQNMIAASRRRWGIDDLPFLATQLGDQGGVWPSYVGSTRDAQLSISPGKGRTTNAAVVSAYDQGDHCGGCHPCVWRQHSGNNCSHGKCCTNPFGFFGVHSRFKQEIGRRMALAVRHMANLSTRPVDWNGPTPVTASTSDGGGTIRLSWQAPTAPPQTGQGTVAMRPTRDCWECCDPSPAAVHQANKDLFQVTTRYPRPDGNERDQVWTNATWVYDAVVQTVTIKPIISAPHRELSEPYVLVRYAASLWPQCAFHSVSNDVPAFSFSDLKISHHPVDRGL
jgi:hypothetical protein